ncbi:MAG: hypothetical protein KAT66_09995 [Candidatus Lokiarchaeota archaeon]|nr:hypothetical protein [Candidatus Lokiarchaeota archaeon]
MNNTDKIILYDSINEIKIIGEFTGSIISKYKDSIIFSENIKITDSEGINISQGLLVGFEDISEKKIAYSRKSDFSWENLEDSALEYCVLIPNDIMELYSEGQFSDAFPFTITLLHTAGLYLNDYKQGINHLDFFKGEILKNPVALIRNGMLIADRVVINDKGDPVFYDCLIVGRDQKEDLNISFEPLANVDDKVVEFIIILGIEELKI